MRTTIGNCHLIAETFTLTTTLVAVYQYDILSQINNSKFRFYFVNLAKAKQTACNVTACSITQNTIKLYAVGKEKLIVGSWQMLRFL